MAMVEIVTEVAWAASGIYVASPVEEYFELCHAEGGGLSEEEQKLTQLITRAPPFHLQPKGFPTSAIPHQTKCQMFSWFKISNSCSWLQGLPHCKCVQRAAWHLLSGLLSELLPDVMRIVGGPACIKNCRVCALQATSVASSLHLASICQLQIAKEVGPFLAIEGTLPPHWH